MKLLALLVLVAVSTFLVSGQTTDDTSESATGPVEESTTDDADTSAAPDTTNAAQTTTWSIKDLLGKIFKT